MQFPSAPVAARTAADMVVALRFSERYNAFAYPVLVQTKFRERVGKEWKGLNRWCAAVAATSSQWKSECNPAFNSITQDDHDYYVALLVHIQADRSAEQLVIDRYHFRDLNVAICRRQDR